MKKEVKEVKEQGWAMAILKDYKKTNIRLFIMWLITFISFVGLLCYTIYLSNDIGTIETTEEVSQNNNGGYNNYIGNDGDINNGYSKDKENS